MNNGIAARLFRSVFGVYCLLATTCTLFQVALEYSNEKDKIAKQVSELAETLIPSLSSSLWVVDTALRDGILKQMFDKVFIRKIQLFDEDNRLLNSLGTDENLDEMNLVKSYHYDFQLNYETHHVGRGRLYFDSNYVQTITGKFPDTFRKL
jgi:uncharacterized membrane protein affecting hemolysin expression